MAITNFTPAAMRARRAAVVAVGMLMLPGSAGADDSAPARALLVNPVQLAAWLGDRDPITASARARVAAATAAAAQTRVLPNPQLGVAVGGFVLGKTTLDDTGVNRHLSLRDTTNALIGVGELVEIGKRGPRQNAADLRIREAGEGAVATLGGRISDATQDLGKLAYVVARRDAVAANLEAARSLQTLEKVRLDNKDLSAAEFARIELDTQALELQLARVEAELANALAVCSATLFAPCTAIGLDQAALDAGAPLPVGLPSAADAITQRPVHQGVRFEAHALGWDATLAHNRRIPDPTLGVGYLFDNLVASGNQHQQLVFSLNVPLPLFDRGNHDAAVARANARAIEAEDVANVRAARGQVDGLLAQRTTFEVMLRRLETEAVPKSAQIIAQTRRSFDLGQARLADLLLVERAHRDLLLDVLETRFELFGVRAQLRQALGLDDEIARSSQRRSP